MTGVTTLDLRADLTEAAWEAITDIYNTQFARDPYVHYDELWDCLRARGFAMASLGCEAALEVIAAVKAHRETESAERRILRWYRGRP